MTKGGLVREALGSKKRREGISRKKTDKFSFIFLVIRGAPRLTIMSVADPDGGRGCVLQPDGFGLFIFSIHTP